MKVNLNNKLYEMSNKQAKQFRKGIEKDFRKGIYAVAKGDYMEMRHDKFKSKQALFKEVMKWNAKGFIAYWKW